MNAHLRAAEVTAAEGEIPIDELKRYMQYCRMKCGPRLSTDAGEKLLNHFVAIRGETHKREVETRKRSAIPITARQLEAIARLSESLAKMQLAPFATEEHVDEAFRLAKVATLDASSQIVKFLGLFLNSTILYFGQHGATGHGYLPAAAAAVVVPSTAEQLGAAGCRRQPL